MWYWGLLEVERVVNVLPQEQVTLMSLYLGWMSAFIVFSWCPRAAVVTALIGKDRGLSVSALSLASENRL